jgi:hypothetical protein
VRQKLCKEKTEGEARQSGLLGDGGITKAIKVVYWLALRKYFIRFERLLHNSVLDNKQKSNLAVAFFVWTSVMREGVLNFV